jgi:hypothetical protein
MKSYGLFFLFFILFSCDFLSSKKWTKEEIIAQEMQQMNWNDLDHYPLFEGCDETADKLMQKHCFETTLTHHLSEILKQHQLVVHIAIKDTIWIHLHINNKGEMSVLTIEKNRETAEEIPQLDSIFSNSIALLPKLFPPLKRDIPVAAKFKLPIVLYID